MTLLSPFVVDCTWAQWDAWGACGSGTQERSRVQDAPAENGGNECSTDDAIETRDCNTDDTIGKIK